MSFYGSGGCPSWVAQARGRVEGRASGYVAGYNTAIEEYKLKYYKKISPKLKAKILEEIKAEIKNEELDKLTEKLRIDITEEISKKLNEEMYEKLEKYQSELNKDTNIFLPNLNIIIDSPNDRIIDAEEYVSQKFESMGYKTKDCRILGKGHPDFIFIKGKERIFVEVKMQGDGLKINQANWILNNKSKRIIVYFVYKNESSNLC